MYYVAQQTSTSARTAQKASLFFSVSIQRQTLAYLALKLHNTFIPNWRSGFFHTRTRCSDCIFTSYCAYPARPARAYPAQRDRQSTASYLACLPGVPIRFYSGPVRGVPEWIPVPAMRRGYTSVPGKWIRGNPLGPGDGASPKSRFV